MPDVSLLHLTKRFGPGAAAVDDLSLEIPAGHFVALLGPSGCGKTTTLRMLAGLETPDAGEVRVGGRVWSSSLTGEFVPPERRGIGLVFQSYALWPHMTVGQNIAFGLQMRGWPRREQRERVAELLELLHIAGLEDRYPAQLSGGQQQRVALARSLAVSPAMLLLDEPLSNLDARLRLEMRAELKRLHGQLGNTIIYVTHDQLEAMTMASLVVVMHSGRLQQAAPPLEVYRCPVNTFVAEFVGSPSMNFFTIDDPISGAAAGSMLTYLRNECGEDDRLVEVRTVGLRPESLRIAAADGGHADGRWSYLATVDALLPTGAEWLVRLEIDGAVCFARAVDEPPFQEFQRVTVAAAARDFHLFDGEGWRLGDGMRGKPGRNWEGLKV